MRTTSKCGYIVTIDMLMKIDDVSVKIIQVDEVAGVTYAEVIDNNDWFNLKNSNVSLSVEDDNDFKEACETELKSDPFSNGYHNGERLIDIRNEDIDWWQLALSKLKNKFILDKMQIIEKGIKNGKVYN